MTYELWIVVWAAILGFIHLMATTLAPLRQPGYLDWVKTNRETAYVMSGKPAILQRAFRNFQETFVFFVVIVAALAFAGKSDAVSMWGARLYILARIAYVPAYLYLGFVRTPVWFLSIVGMAMCLWTLFH